MKQTVRYAFPKTLPVLFGYLFLGIAFGVLLQKAGYSAAWALLISVVVYAGSMQFVLITLLSGGAGLLTSAVMTLLVNSRHMFYGLTFIEKFKNTGKAYPYMIFSLTDETYSLLCSEKVPPELDEKKVLFAISLLDHLYWISGSVIGALAGGLITFDSTGIDFAMTALFVVIFIEQWLEARSHLPAVIGLVSGIVFLILLGPANFILPSLVVTVLALLMLRPLLPDKTKEEKEGQACRSL